MYCYLFKQVVHNMCVYYSVQSVLKIAFVEHTCICHAGLEVLNKSKSQSQSQVPQNPLSLFTYDGFVVIYFKQSLVVCIQSCYLFMVLLAFIIFACKTFIFIYIHVHLSAIMVIADFRIMLCLLLGIGSRISHGMRQPRNSYVIRI